MGEKIKALEKAIEAFDGKDISNLKQAAALVDVKVEANKAAVDGLICYCQKDSDTSAQGASWVLKFWWEKGWAFSSSQANKLIDSLINAESWQLRLHILQLLSGLTIAENQTEKLHYHLRHCLCDTNKFVRAWSYNGLAELAKQYPRYRDEVKQLFELAQNDDGEAASVKARIRNIKI
ncbi:hypothetical protein KFE80_09745 [bacterium SCSIO 12696]|nr:hypothetical protein KFE80_09745 [bacterium SCSIO 12696]